MSVESRSERSFTIVHTCIGCDRYRDRHSLAEEYGHTLLHYRETESEGTIVAARRISADEWLSFDSLSIIDHEAMRLAAVRAGRVHWAADTDAMQQLRV